MKRLSRIGRRASASDTDLARGLVANEDWAAAEICHRFAPMVFGIAMVGALAIAVLPLAPGWRRLKNLYRIDPIR